MKIAATNLKRQIGLQTGIVGCLALVAFLIHQIVSSLPTGWADPQRTAQSTFAGQPTGPGWPHRRGPTFNAVSLVTGLAESWPPQGPRVLWIRDVGRGYSGITGVGRRVYTQSQTLTEQQVLCLDGLSGETLWQHRYAWPYEPGGMYPGPRSTPTLADGRLYFASPEGLVACLDAATGKPLWQLDINQRFSAKGADFGYSCSPTVVAHSGASRPVVILPVGGKGASVVALSADDDTVVWASGNEPASYCSAIPITYQGRALVVTLMQNAMTLFDIATGRRLCYERYSRGYDEHAAAPLYEEPYLVVASAFHGGARCFQLQGDAADLDTLRLEPKWTSEELSNDTASSVLLDGHIYGFDLRDVQAKVHRPSRGTFRCIELATGQTKWSSEKPGHATVIAADGKLVMFNDMGELLLARATPQRYEELARCKIFSGEICWTAPALIDKRLYLRSPTRAACVFLGSDNELDAATLRASKAASEIAEDDSWDWNRLAGGERPYAMDAPDVEEFTRWYTWSLAAAFLPALLLQLVVLAVGHWLRLKRKATFAAAVFWCAAFVLGLVATPLGNHFSREFVLTWPVSLFVAHQMSLLAVVQGQKNPMSTWTMWRSALATTLLVGVCLAFYLVCRRLSLAIAWMFLLGFLPSWLVAVPAARRYSGGRRPLRDFFGVVAGFTLFFWAAAAILLWKSVGLR